MSMLLDRPAERHPEPASRQIHPHDHPHDHVPLVERPGLVGRLARCMGVSVVTTVISVTTIILATTVMGVAAIYANILATSIATIPSYHLNRRWTWGKRDRSDPWREVMPFWVLAFCGLVLSTVTVGFASSWAAHQQLAPVIKTGTILVGHLGGFGILWVLQFILLDRVLFAQADNGG